MAVPGLFMKMICGSTTAAVLFTISPNLPGSSDSPALSRQTEDGNRTSLYSLQSPCPFPKFHLAHTNWTDALESLHIRLVSGYLSVRFASTGNRTAGCHCRIWSLLVSSVFLRTLKNKLSTKRKHFKMRVKLFSLLLSL